MKQFMLLSIPLAALAIVLFTGWQELSRTYAANAKLKQDNASLSNQVLDLTTKLTYSETTAGIQKNNTAAQKEYSLKVKKEYDTLLSQHNTSLEEKKELSKKLQLSEFSKKEASGQNKKLVTENALLKHNFQKYSLNMKQLQKLISKTNEQQSTQISGLSSKIENVSPVCPQPIIRIINREEKTRIPASISKNKPKKNSVDKFN